MSEPVLPSQAWDRHTIKAEINRRGMTLTGIALSAGLNECACRQALFGLSRKGAEAIAAALDIPFDTLFPTGFLRSRQPKHASARHSKESRQKREDAPAAAGSRL